MPINSYSLAANYGGSPTNIESISVTGGEDLRPFYSKLQSAAYFHAATDSPYTIPYSKTAAGTFTQQGYPSFVWRFPYIGATSYKYLLETYAQKSTYRGKVTVGARSLEWDVYANVNADMFLSPVTEQPYCRGSNYYFRDVTARFIVRS